jgi:hypothetical protein
MPRAVLAVSFFLISLAGAAVAQVSGVVVDAATSQPIAGALVTLQATGVRVTSAGNGTFTLPATGTGLRVVAARKGYLNAGVTASAPAAGLTISLSPVQVGNNLGYQLVDPSTCGICHPSQLAEWTGSPMSGAGTNTWVYDIYDGSGTPGGMGGFVYLRDSVWRTSHPNSDCASCHQPEPWVKQPYRAMEPIGNLSQASMHGVSCDVCHKIAHVDESKMNYPGIYPGAVVFNLPNSPLSSHQVVYGVLGDVDFQATGLMRASYQPQLVAQVCGVCHQDKNDPDGDGDFEEANGVVSEPTYEEWVGSAYGDPSSPSYRTCVDCHMPPSTDPQVCSLLPLPRSPGTARSHRIEGTTPAFLENAVDLRLEVRRSAGALSAVVAIDNRHTGHHVPTGVTTRNMVLLVEAWRVADGVRLPLVSGPVLHSLAGVGSPDQGYYAGLPGKLYAKVNADALGNSPTFFTDATSLLWDTRIPANATDTTLYHFSIPPGSGQVTVRARLIYRRAWRALVDQKQWTTDGHGNPLADVAAPIYGHLMEESQWTSPGTGPVATFGAGCGGLRIGSEGLPFVGSTQFAVTLAGAPRSAFVLMWLGLSSTSWGGSPLPLDLTLAGAPGCHLLASLDLTFLGTTDLQGRATLPVSLPQASLIGLRLHSQWAAPAANQLGWQTSDGLSFTVQR